MEMQQTIEGLFTNEVAGIKQLVANLYTEGVYNTAFEIQKGVNVGWSLPSVDDRQLDAVLSKPWTLDGETFSDRIWKHKDALVAELQTELTQSLLRGDGPDKAISAISKTMVVSKNQAGRLVMTESAYFSSVAQRDCFNSLGVEKFEFVATLDSHTSELCQSLDGTIELMRDFKPGVTAPPLHCWCRSTTVPYITDNHGERFARDNKGRTSYVPGDMKYPEWKKKYIDPTPQNT
jgi:SPP1 gp7 family putative phage head morphogenesis protein